MSRSFSSGTRSRAPSVHAGYPLTANFIARPIVLQSSPQIKRNGSSADLPNEYMSKQYRSAGTGAEQSAPYPRVQNPRVQNHEYRWLVGKKVPEMLFEQLVNFPTFLITWGTFFAAGIVTFLIQMYRNRQILSFRAFMRHCFPFNVWSTKTVHMDVKIYIVRKCTDFLFVTPSLASTALVSTIVSQSLRWLVPNYVVTRPTYLIIVGCSVAIFLVVEFSDYLVHYLEHRIPFLWELHKVHHSAVFLNPLTSKRGYSLPLVYVSIASGSFSALPVGVFAFLFGFSLPEALVLRTTFYAR
jgi:sterol desaturase/sphingolipid hydroxylase (fatty acid hydroxylase superfamily)